MKAVKIYSIYLTGIACAALPVNAATFSDDFESYTGGGATFANQTSDWSKFNGNQFFVVDNTGLAGNGSGQALDAPGGTTNLTGANPVLLGSGEQFSFSALIGFDGAANWGGLFMGTPNARVSLEVGLSAGPGVNALIRKDIDGNASSELSNPAGTIVEDTWYEFTISGVQGASEVSVDLVNTNDGTTVLSNQIVSLDTFTIPENTRFGVAASAADNFKADNFSIATGTDVPEPSTYAAIVGLLALVAASFRRCKQR